MRGTKIIVGFAALALSAGCGSAETERELGSRSSAIVGGELDEGHSFVAFVYDTSLYGCTATLIDEDVLLTAAHCTAQLSSSTSPLMVWSGTDYVADETDWESGVASLHTNPAYNPSNFTVGDFGIVILDAPAPVKPVRWLDADPGSIYATSTEFTQVGYGATAPGADSGVKHEADFEVLGVLPETFSFGNAATTACFGDSGSPGLLANDGYLTVFGVLTSVDTECDAAAGNGRTDFATSFISVFASPEAGTVRAGGGGGDGGGGLVGCSVGAHGSARGMLVLLGLLLLRRRRY